jgi:hypothetical protein
VSEGGRRRGGIKTGTRGREEGEGERKKEGEGKQEGQGNLPDKSKICKFFN